MPSYVEIGPVVLGKKIFKFRQAILLLFPFGIGRGPSIVLFLLGCFVSSLVEIGRVFLKK